MKQFKIKSIVFFLFWCSGALLHAQKGQVIKQQERAAQREKVQALAVESGHKMALSITGGLVQDGFGGILTLDYKFNDYDFLQANFQGNFATVEHDAGVEADVNLYAFNLGLFFDLLRNNNRKFAIAVGGGASVGYETFDTPDNADFVLRVDDTLVYGGYLGLDLDVFIVPSVTLNLKANEYYHINSEVGKLNPYVGLGVKLILF